MNIESRFDYVRPYAVRTLMMYIAACSTVGAAFGVLVGCFIAPVCALIGGIWLTARLVWGW